MTSPIYGWAPSQSPLKPAPLRLGRKTTRDSDTLAPPDTELHPHVVDVGLEVMSSDNISPLTLRFPKPRDPANSREERRPVAEPGSPKHSASSSQWSSPRSLETKLTSPPVPRPAPRHPVLAPAATLQSQLTPTSWNTGGFDWKLSPSTVD